MRVALPSLLFLTLGSVVAADETKFYTQELCSTKLGSKSQRHVATATNAVTATVVLPARTKVVRSTSTVTPATVTVSQTSTSTATSYVTTQTTDTATTTLTETETDTVTSTATSTTTTTTTSTSTVASTTTIAPAGFTPILSSSSYVPRDIQDASADRLFPRGTRKQDNTLVCKGGKPKRPAALRYPQKVNCKAAVEAVIARTKTRTASPTTITAAAPTTTQTVSVTTTATDTSTLADVTVTETETDTETSTSTATTTSTVTATTTVTDAVPSATEYAICGADNFANSANGAQALTGVEPYAQVDYYSDTTSAAQCCSRCQAATSCSYFVYISNSCYLGHPTTCQAGVNNANFYTSAGSDPADGFTVGNGACGAIRDAGTY